MLHQIWCYRLRRGMLVTGYFNDEICVWQHGAWVERMYGGIFSSFLYFQFVVGWIRVGWFMSGETKDWRLKL